VTALLCGACSKAGTPAVAPVVVTHGLGEEGVVVDGSESQGFQAAVRELAGPWADSVLALGPHAVIISNRSQSTIVALAVRFHSTRPDGRYVERDVHFKYPDAVAGRGGQSPFERGRELQPEERRIVGPIFELNTTSDNRWLEDYAKTFAAEAVQAGFVRVDISVDGVVFNDGRVAGVGAAKLIGEFQSLLAAKQAVYKDVIAKVESGMTVDQAFGPIGDPSNRLKGDSSGLDEQQVRNLARLWRRQYDDATLVSVFRKAIRVDDFVLHSR
jgi:hypothetical protein